MKFLLMILLLLNISYAVASADKIDEISEKEDIVLDSKIPVESFSDTQVTSALETADSTLDLIGRDIASEGEIEVVE